MFILKLMNNENIATDDGVYTFLSLLINDCANSTTRSNGEETASKAMQFASFQYHQCRDIRRKGMPTALHTCSRRTLSLGSSTLVNSSSDANFSSSCLHARSLAMILSTTNALVEVVSPLMLSAILTVARQATTQ